MNDMMLWVLGGAASLIGTIGGYFVNSVMGRLKTVEEKVDHKTSEEDVRRILADKIDPVREDIHELKIKIDKIVDLLLKR